MKPASSLLYATCILLVSCFNPFNKEQPALTRQRDLGLTTQRLIVPRKFSKDITITEPVFLPPGFTARIFYAGRLDKARFMAWSPDSILHVANKSSGEILALPDRNHDGEADTAIVVARDLHLPHDLKFHDGALFVTEERRVVRLTDNDRDGIYEQRTVFIDAIAQGARQPGGGHDTRTIVFDPQHHALYLSIGSSCNVCREDERAIIERYADDGTGRRVYARGVRNAVGMALHPRTGRLWATNNGSDWQGDDIPPEWIDEVRDGGFYGHPFAWGDGRYSDFTIPVGGYRDLLPITVTDSILVRSMRRPAALLQAHSAPMAIEFPNPSFSERFRNGAFVALRGSWNRRVPDGYKVVYLHMKADSIVDYVSDFLIGFTTKSGAWARPVGLATDSRGNLYMSSDANKEFIAIISPSKQ